jgi:hypothetical protein
VLSSKDRFVEFQYQDFVFSGEQKFVMENDTLN